MGNNNAKFDAEFESVEKVAKKFIRKKRLEGWKLLYTVLKSGLEPGWKKSGSGINMPDPQHWMLYVYLPLEWEVLLEDVQEADHLWEDEDPVPLLAEARQQLVQQHQLTRPVDQLLQPLSLRIYIVKFTCQSINQRELKIYQSVTRKF